MPPAVLTSYMGGMKEWSTEKSRIIDWLKIHGTSLERAPGWPCDDEDVVKAAMRMSPTQLQFASDRLRDDPAMVSLTFHYWGCQGLEYASERLKDDASFILEGLKYSVYAYEKASERLQHDPHIAIKAIRLAQSKDQAFVLNFVPPQLLGDITFAAKAIEAQIDVEWLAKNSLFFAGSLLAHLQSISTAPPVALWSNTISCEGLVKVSNRPFHLA